MFFKRQIPIAIVASVGALTLFGWFIDHPGIKSFIDDDATQWFDILASFAIFLGALNLLKVQIQKIGKRESGWPFSIFAIAGFLFAFSAGFLIRGGHFVEITHSGGDLDVIQSLFQKENQSSISKDSLRDVSEENPLRLNLPYFTGKKASAVAGRFSQAGAESRVVSMKWGAHIQTKGSLFNWIFSYIITPLSATMFALLAFFVASASYRAFRIRNFEATLLLLAGIIIMLGRIPAGSRISSWFVLYLLVFALTIAVNSWSKNRVVVATFFVVSILSVTIAGVATGWPVDRPAVFYLPSLQEWIYNVPNVAGARAIMIGIGLGIIATSVRYILGIEKSYIGD